MLNSDKSLSSFNFGKEKEPEYQTPRQMVPLWSDAVLHQAESVPRAVFGGRLMFYGADKHKPIQVDGTLIVYAWNDEKATWNVLRIASSVFHWKTSRNTTACRDSVIPTASGCPCDVAGGRCRRCRSSPAHRQRRDRADVNPRSRRSPRPGQSHHVL